MKLGGVLKAVLLGVLLPSAAHADSSAPSLFGITLGQSAGDMATCPFIPNTLRFHGDSICLIKNSKISKAWGAEEFDVNLPAEKPDYLFTMHVAAFDGKIVEVVVGTHGLNYQDIVYKALRDKFGKPASAKTDVMQNAFGAKYKRLRAQWRLKNATLTMYGAESSVDSGAIYLADRGYSKRVDDYTRARENILRP